MSVPKQNMTTFTAGGSISLGQAVKLSDDVTAIKVTGVTDRAVGVAQNNATIGQFVEVAMIGGGAFGLAKTTINRGDLLGMNADASLQKVDAANSIVIAQALQDASANDIFDCMVIGPFQATAAQS